MIQVTYRTNLNDINFSSSPEYLSCRPEIGDYIKVRFKGQDMRLKISSITHVMVKNYVNSQIIPGLEIELNK